VATATLTAHEKGLLYEAGELDRQASRDRASHAWFETAWMCEPAGPLRELFQAMAQIAASLHLRATREHTAAVNLAFARIFVRGTERLKQPGVVDALDLLPFPPNTGMAAVLIAGGQGLRAGGPKALIVRDGVPLWRWQIARLAALGVGPIAAVVHPAALADAADPPSGVHCVPSNPSASPFASLQAGLAALGSEVGAGVFVLPVDCPCPGRSVFVRLAATAVARRALGKPWDAVRPFMAVAGEKRRGHPVLLAPATCERVLQGDPVTGRLDVVLRELAHVIDAWTDDAGVLANFNRDGVTE
jgi:CTP:molybdopterin cytidylyltransferase MocA